jgi:hypothetical protein
MRFAVSLSPRLRADSGYPLSIVAFESFNELDSIAALTILNRVRKSGWRTFIASPLARVSSTNGVAIEALAALADARGGCPVFVRRRAECGKGAAARAISS